MLRCHATVCSCSPSTTPSPPVPYVALPTQLFVLALLLPLHLPLSRMLRCQRNCLFFFSSTPSSPVPYVALPTQLFVLALLLPLHLPLSRMLRCQRNCLLLLFFYHSIFPRPVCCVANATVCSCSPSPPPPHLSPVPFVALPKQLFVPLLLHPHLSTVPYVALPKQLFVPLLLNPIFPSSRMLRCQRNCLFLLFSSSPHLPPVPYVALPTQLFALVLLLLPHLSPVPYVALPTQLFVPLLLNPIFPSSRMLRCQRNYLHFPFANPAGYIIQFKALPTGNDNLLVMMFPRSYNKQLSLCTGFHASSSRLSKVCETIFFYVN